MIWTGTHPDGSLFGNVLKVFLGQGIRLGIQVLYFVLIARSLGLENYGAFIGVTAFTAIIAPFAGWGSSQLLIKNVARDTSCYPTQWGNGLLATTGSGIVLSMLTWFASKWILPPAIPSVLVIVLCISELILSPINDLAIASYQSVGKITRFSQVNVVMPLFRLIAAGVLAFSIPEPTALAWAYFYMTAAAASTAILVTTASREIGRPRFALQTLFVEFKEGLYFAINISAWTIYNDVDKTMLARLSSLDAAGIYGAAYRVISASFTPIRSLLLVIYPRFFQVGNHGILATLKFTASVLPRALGTAMLISLVTFAIAPLMPRLLGPQYWQAAEALRWLSLLPAIKTMHHLSADALTGANYQGLRSAIQIAVAGFNTLINLWLIPNYGWRGAAWSSLASDGLLAIALIAALLLIKRSENVRIPASVSAG